MIRYVRRRRSKSKSKSKSSLFIIKRARGRKACAKWGSHPSVSHPTACPVMRGWASPDDRACETASRVGSLRWNPAMLRPFLMVMCSLTLGTMMIALFNNMEWRSFKHMAFDRGYSHVDVIKSQSDSVSRPIPRIHFPSENFLTCVSVTM